jgi:group I intron endonuclease
MSIGIYKITSPSNKIYIGQSTNLKKREDDYKKLRCDKQPKLYNSIQCYGWEQHKFDIIEECSLEQLNEREIYWGLYYDVLGENGLNLRLGDANGLCSQETKDKIGLSNSGPKPEGFNQKLSKSVLQFDLKGNLIAEYTSYNNAVKATGLRLAEVLRGAVKTAGGYTFKYKNEWDGKPPTIKPHGNLGKQQPFKGRVSPTKGKSINKKPKTEEFKNKLSKPILQLDLEDNLIKEFKSQTEIKHILNIDPQNVLRGKTKTAGGYKWKYKNE